MHASRHHRRYAIALTAALLALAACRDNERDAAANDSALARDLSLANAVSTATPELRDTPDSAPPVVEAPLSEPQTPRQTTPTRATVRDKPKPVAPKPQPVAPKPEPTPTVAETPAPVPAAPAPRVGVIAAGTSVGLPLDSRACSDANRPGDKMVAHTSEAITGSDGIVWPAGSTVVIEVASVVESGGAGRPSRSCFPL